MLSINQTEHKLKRRRSQSPDRPSHISAKRQCQHDFLDQWVPSRRFWDTLPKIYLTRRALNEHDRRNRLKSFQAQAQQNVPPIRRRSARLQSARIKQSLIVSTVNTGKPSLELVRFARHGGPDLTSLRGYPDPTMSDRASRPSKRTNSSGQTASSKRSGPYDANYQLKLAQAGVFLTEQIDESNDVVLPTNYDSIVAKLNNPRRSLSPSRFTEKDSQRFRRQTEQEILEAETMQKSIAVIEGDGSQIYSRMGNPFNNLKPFDPELAMAVPDSYDGAPPLSIDHRVLNSLDEYIVPNTDSTRPAAPNFFLEGKSRKGRADVAKRQAAQTGAIGARGIMRLQSYPSQAPQYGGNAYSFTSTYHDGQLKIYTTHVAAPKTAGDPPQYHMTQIRAYAMTGDHDTFIKGATNYRNARDLAKQQRDQLIQNANQAARLASTSKHSGRKSSARSRSHASTNTVSLPTTGRSEDSGSAPDTDTSTDELAFDKVVKRS